MEHGIGAEAGHGIDLGAVLPLWSALPFAGILLSIALFPLLAPHFWHRHFPKVAAFWAVLFAVPFVAVYRGSAVQELVHILLVDYLPFLILLWALFIVAGGIYVGGSLRATPLVNVVLLAIGTLLASWIGTTGAAMVMIRPVLRANEGRRHRVHVFVFFIFLVANAGGALTPLGDPPLFLGFLHGVPFFWVTRALLPHVITMVALLLAIFAWLDARALRREPEFVAATRGEPAKVRIDGAHNLVFLLLIMAAVLFSGSVELGAIPVLGHVQLEWQNVLRDLALVVIGLLALRTTAPRIREANGFSWAPILEVAYLFAGIFVTIVPALKILQAGEHGALGWLIGSVTEPLHYFWAAGTLSGFLDNAPTYLTFFNTALGAFGMPESAVPGMLGAADASLRDPRFAHVLEAISAGAVFMGANTYIGNAPNFMVKAIAEEAGVPMPSFFGYLFRYSLPILFPTYVLLSLLFF